MVSLRNLVQIPASKVGLNYIFKLTPAGLTILSND
jgi:hypothetical protein